MLEEREDAEEEREEEERELELVRLHCAEQVGSIRVL